MDHREKEYLELLNKKFDESAFIDFVRDLLNLNQFDISNNIEERKDVPKQYQENINYYKYIAKYNDGINNIGILIVKLGNKTSTNARTAQRNFIATILSKYDLDASLVAFYSDKENNWRLSFVKKEIDFTDKGFTISLSPAKRFSYLVGENESVHTAKEYLLKLLKINDRKINIDDIEQVFDVEKVTKRFFEEYKEKYLQLKEYLDNNDEFLSESKKADFNSVEFAKKLMGQIVFLYFLQKKGWLGVQLVPNKMNIFEFNELLSNNDIVSQNVLNMFYELKDDYYVIEKTKLRLSELEEDVVNLSNIFKNTKYDMAWGTGEKDFIRSIYKQAIKEHRNFFDDYLEPFFYKGLNEQRENQYFALFNCKIPFLNGGLFEPINNYRWSSAHFSIPNNLFSNSEKNGILDFLDLYNFTIDEEEPLEKDIAVDPEMLGKIFENLLEVDDRKSKGAFYTPRDIVYYMCQESIANYLSTNTNASYNDIMEFIKYGDLITQLDWEKHINNDRNFYLKQTIFEHILDIDKALLDVKIADPAVGSGAFPLGMLTEIVKIRDNISIYMLIQNDLKIINLDSIYNTDQSKRGLFDMKLQTIENSIYAVDIEQSAVDITKLRLWLSLIVDYPNDEEPRPLPNLDCKIMQGNSLFDEFEGVPLFSKKILSNNLKNYNRTESKLNQVRDIHIQQVLQFDDSVDLNDFIENMLNLQKEYFKTSNNKLKKALKEKIDNIQLGMVEETLKNDPQRLSRFKTEAKKKQKPWFIWELEFYDVFKTNSGFDIIIGNPPYGAKFTSKEKSILKQKYEDVHMRTPDSFNYFISLSLKKLKQNGILSFIVPNNLLFQMENEKTRDLLLNKNYLYKVINIGDNVFENATVPTCIFFDQKRNLRNYVMEYTDLRFENRFNVQKGYMIQKKEINILPNIILGVKPDEIKIFEKIKSNSYTIDDLVTDVACGISSGGDKIFKVNQEIINIYNLEKEYLYPLIYGREINKYSIDYRNDKIIYLDRNININLIPNIINYLSNYKEILAKRSEVKSGNIKWYEMNRPRTKELFENDKIVIRQTADTIICAYDNAKYYTLDSILVLQLKNEYKKFYLGILGALNSKINNFIYKVISQEDGRTFPQVKPNNVRKLYVPQDSQILIELGNIVQSKSGFEREELIDNILCKYYKLTDSDIKYIYSKYDNSINH